MSIISPPPPFTHSPYSDSQVTHTRATAGPSPIVLVPQHKQQGTATAFTSIEGVDLSVPIPALAHRHTAPFPSISQSFSALGPPEMLARPPPPPAPRSPPMDLPPPSLNFNSPSAGVLKVPDHIVFPPTPDPSPPNSKVLFPDAMIKLAPPAEEAQPVHSDLDRRFSDDIPRRLPLASIDAIIGEQLVDREDPSPPANRPRSKSQLLDDMKSPEVKPPRPKAPRRSQTAIHPTSVRMGESLSADSRARLRNVALVRHANSHVSRPRSPSPGFARAMKEAHAITPRNTSAPEQPDMGGPDGLEAKVVLLGSQGVGKTSLILRYTTRQFSPSPAAATIGSSLHTRKLVHSGVRVKLQIWDTAGQERFRSMAPIYYRGSHVCVLVYDISDKTSFDDVRSWLEELRRTVPKETVIYVVGAKVDLASKRAISLDHAKSAIRLWLKPPPVVPSQPTEFLSPPMSRTGYRNFPAREASRPDSIITSPTPLRSRSHSHDALSSLATPVTANVTPTASAPLPRPRGPSRTDSTSSSIPFPRAQGSASARPRPVSMMPTMQITAPKSKAEKRLSFPALASPTAPTFATNTDHVTPSITPASPARSGHGMSGGRFSISGVLGYSRTTSMSGAMSNLSRLAEDFPASPKPSILKTASSGSPAQPPRLSHSSTSPPRVRIDSMPYHMSFDRSPPPPGELGARRKSEDWTSAPSSRNYWRMGEGPSAADTLGEFGEGVRKRQSAELLSSAGMSASASASGFGSGSRPGSASARASASAVFDQSTGNPTLGRHGHGHGEASGSSGTGGAGSGGTAKGGVAGRKRGGSLGRDSRLYGLGYGEAEEETQWGIEVEGVRLGECSALTGEGVEALFKSISSVLVHKKDKIERERTIRRQGSVMLSDPKEPVEAGKKQSSKGYGCC